MYVHTLALEVVEVTLMEMGLQFMLIQGETSQS